MVLRPIAIVIRPTAPCKPLLAQVSQRADSAIGTAITVDSAPIPIIEPIPTLMVKWGDWFGHTALAVSGIFLALMVFSVRNRAADRRN